MMFFLALTLLGVISLFRLQVELYQGASKGIVSIMVRVRGGLAPREVEKLITKPVEETIATVSHIKNLYSNSREGEARITLEFEPGTDMNFAALEVREKFAKVRNKLPKEIEKPVIANYNDSDSAIMVFSVTSESKSPEDIRQLVDNKVKPLLSRVNGVASVDVFGGRERKILIELDRDQMYAYGISSEKVMDIIGAANLELVGGSVPTGSKDLSIRTMGGLQSVDEIGDIGIASNPQGSIITLKEIATVKDSYMEPSDYARLNLTQNVSVQVKKASGANTISVCKDAAEAIDYFRQIVKDDLKFTTISDNSKSIRKAINEVFGDMKVGLMLTTVILYLFLRRISLALLMFISIPASLVVTFICMDVFDISINVMTLTGIAMAIGMLTDNAVVIMENIVKKTEEGIWGKEAIIEGSEELWLVLLASTATTVSVFLPIMFIDKSIQLVYQGLAFTVTTCLIASLFVSLGIVPMLAHKMGLFEKPDKEKMAKLQAKAAKTAGKKHWFYRFYRALVMETFRARYPFLAIVLIVFAICGYGISKMDIDLPTTLEENEFSVVIFPIAGADLEANNVVGKKVEDLLRTFPEVDTISTVVRKDDLRVFVRLKPRKERKNSKEEIMNYVREKGEETIKEVHEDYSLIVDEGVSSDESRKIVVNVFGHENDKLEELAHEVSQRMGKIQGVSNIVMTDLRKRPEYDLVVDRGRAAFYGLTVKDVADSLHSQIRGMRPSKYREIKEGEEIEMISRLQAIYRQKIEDLLKIYIFSPVTREAVLLEQIANFHPSFGPNTIDRKDKYRYVFVKGDTNAALETSAKKVKEALADLQFPQDYFYRFGGAYSDLMKNKSQLSYAVLITIFLVYMILACLFQSYIQPLVILVAVPLAVIGVYIGLRISNKTLSEHVFIGMIILAGAVVNSSTVMMDHYNFLRTKLDDKIEILLRSGEDRVRPIAITALSSILGFVPMALGLGEASNLWSPLAITVIGGLTSSTILTLFVIPNILLLVEDVKMFLVSAGSFINRMKAFAAGKILPKRI